MLSKAKTLNGYSLIARDGEIGKVKEFYFDDKHWTIRYLVADTGNWLTGRKVLISPYALLAVQSEKQHISIDDETWAIRYLIVGTRNWWPGKQVLISPRWIKRVSWSESKVFVNLLRENIRLSPAYTAESLLTRDYEVGLHRHYDRQGYWMPT